VPALKAKKMAEISKFDAADYLKTPVVIAAYLAEAFETSDPVYIRTALDTVARAKGMTDSRRKKPR
jgi:probable addiction module antidote protein